MFSICKLNNLLVKFVLMFTKTYYRGLEMINKEELKSLLKKAELIIGDECKLSKDFILSLFYFKYICDIYNERVKNINEEFFGDERAISGKISRFTITLTEDTLFDYFYKNINKSNIKSILKAGIIKFKSNHKNDAWLSSVITAINLDYIPDYIDKIKVNVIRELLELFNACDLSGKEEYDLMVTAFEYFHHWKFSFQSFREYTGM